MNIQKWINCILQFFHCFFCKFCQGTPPSGALQLAVPAHVFFAAPVASGEVLTHPPAPMNVRKKSSPTERDAGKTWGSTGIAHFNQFQWRFSLIWHLNLTHRLKLSLLLDYSFKPWLTWNKSSFVLHVIADTRNMSTLERFKYNKKAFWNGQFQDLWTSWAGHDAVRPICYAAAGSVPH